MRIRGLLFDKDGTLIDSMGTWMPVYREILATIHPDREDVWDQLLDESGYDPAVNGFRANSVMAVGTTDQMVDLWWSAASDTERRERIAWVDAAFVRLSEKHLTELLPLAPVLNDLRSRGYTTGVATNDNEASARNHVRILGLEAQFDFICGYDTVARAKPYGDMVHAFCAATGLAPQEVAVIGDNLHDLDMARDAGAGLAIGVLTGSSRREHLEPHADAVLASVADLAGYLESRG